MYYTDDNDPNALKRDLLEETTHIWIHEDKWKLIHGWYGGGPIFPRKVTIINYSGGAFKHLGICEYPSLNTIK